jgi:cytochrome d ubiquinol oxidase subunit I
LLAFAIVYFVVFAMGTYYILHLMAAPPHRGEEGLSEEMPSHAAGITALPPVHAPATSKGGS